MQKILWIKIVLLSATIALANAGSDSFPPPSVFCFDFEERGCPPGFDNFKSIQGSPDDERWFTCCKERLSNPPVNWEKQPSINCDYCTTKEDCPKCPAGTDYFWFTFRGSIFDSTPRERDWEICCVDQLDAQGRGMK